MPLVLQCKRLSRWMFGKSKAFNEQESTKRIITYDISLTGPRGIHITCKKLRELHKNARSQMRLFISDLV